MPFRSSSAYDRFEHLLRTECRHVLCSEIQEFLKALLETSKTRLTELPRGAIVWRAQIGFKGIVDVKDQEGGSPFEFVPFPKRRLKPPRNHKSEGRANVRGIPCLYVSTDRRTAVAELRPEIGAHLSVACLKLRRHLRVIDATNDELSSMEWHSRNRVKSENDLDFVVRRIWSQINRAFSRPVTREDSATNYIPTQVLAEFFRQNGFDGIAYRSSQGPGHNIALFNLCDATIQGRFTVAVRSVEYKIDCLYPHSITQSDEWCAK